MYVVDRHLVHPFEVGERDIELRLFPGREDRFGALPIGQRAQRRVGRHQVVEVGRARARQAADHDGPADLDLENLRVAPDEVLDEEAIAQELCELDVRGRDPGGPVARLVVERPAEHFEVLTKGLVAEVVEAGLGDRGLHQTFGLQLQQGTGVGERRPNRLVLRREPRVREVVDANRRRARAHPAVPVGTSSTLTTLVVGRAGVATGWNHRNQIRPRG